MTRVVIIGNSGSGKSTLAHAIARAGAAHLDLDGIAWRKDRPTERAELQVSREALQAFTDAHEQWVIEGCYADIAAMALHHCDELLFLDPGVEACQDNCRARPWEPHKYPSKAEQDANLGFLLKWVAEYATRDGPLSLAAHRALFDRFGGRKRRLDSREAIAAAARAYDAGG